MKSIILLLLSIVPTYFLVKPKKVKQDASAVYFNIEKAKLNMTDVEVLDLTNKGYNKLPQDMSMFIHLKELRLSGNNFTVLSNKLEPLKELESLDLGNNVNIDLKQSIPFISKSKKLKHLYLNDCDMFFVPSNIYLLQGLETLDLSGNYIFELPYYMSKIKNLKHVDLSGNKLLELGYAPSLWSKLETINLKDNDSLDLENAFLALSYLKKLSLIELSNVSEIPNNISELKCNSITFVNSSLREIPETLSENKVIKSITLEDCKAANFKQLFAELGEANQLEEIRLSNCFDKIPNGLKKLHNLKTLDISNNELSSIRLSATDFPNLKRLKINGNNITSENLIYLEKQFPNCNIVSKNQVASEVKTSISPPIEDLQIERTEYKIDPTKQEVLNYGETKITIPKNAFVDKNGKAINTPVDIEYREFHDPLDVILSGIPMSYDTSGVQANLETAGMIEFRATSQGEEVFPNEKAMIKIDLDSKRTEKGYNTYQFDESSNAWNYVSPSVGVVQEDVRVVPVTAYQLDSDFYVNARLLRKSKPSMGIDNVYFTLQRPKGSKNYFVTDNRTRRNNVSHRLSTKTLSAFKKFSMISEDAAVKSTRRSMKLFNKKHENFQSSYLISQYIEVDKENDCFNIVAVYVDTTIKFPVRVVTKAHNSERDQKKTLKFWKYYNKMKRKEDLENKAVERAYKMALNSYEEEIVKIQEENRELIAKNNKEETSLKTVRRSFSLEGFGIWNCDRIGVAEEPILVKAIFKDVKGNVYQPENVMVIDETDNGVIAFVGGQISMDRSNDNAIVVTSKSGMIGFIRSRDVKLLMLKDKTEAIIPLTYVNTKDVSIAELKNMIQS